MSSRLFPQPTSNRPTAAPSDRFNTTHSHTIYKGTHTLQSHNKAEERVLCSIYICTVLSGTNRVPQVPGLVPPQFRKARYKTCFLFIHTYCLVGITPILLLFSPVGCGRSWARQENTIDCFHQYFTAYKFSECQFTTIVSTYNTYIHM